MEVPRGKVTGGTSAINGQVFLRPLVYDFDHWTALGNDEWTYQDTLPYMRKMETDTDFSDDYHGTDGPIIVRRHKLDTLQPEQAAFYDACLEMGFPKIEDHNHPGASGVGPYPLNNPGGVRWEYRHRIPRYVPPPPEPDHTPPTASRGASCSTATRRSAWKWKAETRRSRSMATR